MFTIGQQVVTEFGAGEVSHVSERRVVVALSCGESINVASGTPGYYRIKVA
jgi:hypothetical protein